MKFLIFILSFLFFIQLNAYAPGKWSHLDAYILGTKKNGPLKEEVKNEKEEVIYTANYTYDSDGFLVKEVYYKPNGVLDGQTIYIYEDNKIRKEELSNGKGELMETKVFKYDTKSRLQEIVVFDGKGKEVLLYRVKAMKKDMLVHAEIVWYETKDIEVLILSKVPDSLDLIQEVNDDKKKVSIQTRLVFNTEGKLTARINAVGELQRKSEIFYDKSGRIERITFMTFKNKKWTTIKTHYLYYHN